MKFPYWCILELPTWIWLLGGAKYQEQDEAEARIWYDFKSTSYEFTSQESLNTQVKSLLKQQVKLISKDHKSGIAEATQGFVR